MVDGIYFQDASKTSGVRLVIRKWVSIGAPFFTDRTTRFEAWLLLVGCLGLNAFSTMVSVHLSYEQRDFSSALQKKDAPVFWTHLTRYLLIVNLHLGL